MKAMELSQPFAVSSDVHGNLPALEIILAVEFVRVPHHYHRLLDDLAATPLITSFTPPTSFGSE